MSWVSPPVIATGTLVTAAMWNSNFSYLYDSGWVPLVIALGGSFSNGWSSCAGPVGGNTCGIRIIGNVVRLGGQLTGGSSGTGPGTLQAAYRPAYPVTLTGQTTITTNTVVYCSVSTGGLMVLAFASGTVPSLDGMTWTVD